MNLKIQKNIKSALACLTLTLTGTAVLATDTSYPSKPITIIAPFPAGGVVDVTARLIADKMQGILKATMIVDNRPGAGGTVGSAMVARSKADGYTLLLGDPATHIYSPTIYSKVPYDAFKSFTPIGQISFGPLVVVAGSRLKVKTAQELTPYLLNAGDKENYGSNGNGSTPHLAAELYKQTSGVKTTHVPYGGGPANMTALVSGDVGYSINHIPLALGMIKSGKLRALATTGAKRSPVFPELPTLMESGVKGYEAYAWFALYAPAGLPADVQAKLTSTLKAALQDPELKAKMNALGDEPFYRNPTELTEYMKTETARWVPLIKASGIAVD